MTLQPNWSHLPRPIGPIGPIRPIHPIRPIRNKAAQEYLFSGLILSENPQDRLLTFKNAK